METLNKDVLLKLALDLDLASLVKFCKSSKRINATVCNDNMFWFNKLRKDYPNAFDVPQGSDYEKIYKSINKRIYTSYKSFTNVPKPNEIAKISDYIKKEPAHYRNVEDLDYIARIDPNFETSSALQKRLGGTAAFNSIHPINIIGIYPAGTKIWVFYTEMLGEFLPVKTKEEAIENLLEYSRNLAHFTFKTTFEKLFKMTEEQFRNAFKNSNSFQIKNVLGKTTNFVVKEITLP